MENILWKGKPSHIFDTIKTFLHINFVDYTLTDQRLKSKKGFMFRLFEEIELYRVQDQKIHQSIFGKMVNVGDIVIFSTDTTTPMFILKNIKDPEKVKDLIRETVVKCREEMKLKYREDL